MLDVQNFTIIFLNHSRQLKLCYDVLFIIHIYVYFVSRTEWAATQKLMEMNKKHKKFFSSVYSHLPRGSTFNQFAADYFGRRAITSNRNIVFPNRFQCVGHLCWGPLWILNYLLMLTTNSQMLFIFVWL